MSLRQVRPPHIADKQRIAREHRVRIRTALQVRHQEANALQRVPRRLEDLQPAPSERNLICIPHRFVTERGAGAIAEINCRSRELGELVMPRNEIGVQVRFDDVTDRETVLARRVEIDIDIALRIDHGRHALRANQIGSMRQTAKIELFKYHPTPWVLTSPLPSSRSNSCTPGPGIGS